MSILGYLAIVFYAAIGILFILFILSYDIEKCKRRRRYKKYAKIMEFIESNPELVVKAICDEWSKKNSYWIDNFKELPSVNVK